MTADGYWRIERLVQPTGDPESWPLVLTVEGNGKAMHFHTRGLWPAPRANLYLRRCDLAKHPGERMVVEQVPLLNLEVVHGAAQPSGSVVSTINLAIDRRTKTRCSIFVKRDHDIDGKLVKEVIYLRTESGTKGHRTRTYLQPSTTQIPHEIVIDTREKYPWAFKAGRVIHQALRAGDYALRAGERIVAVIERKSYENMLSMLTNLESYHAHLSELATFPACLLIVEAQYGDFINPKKTGELSNKISVARCARALANVAVRHPRLQVQFAGNRKYANLYAVNWFAQHAAALAGTAQIEAPVQGAMLDDAGRPNTGGMDADVREAVMTTLPSPLSVTALAAAFPGVPRPRLVQVLNELRTEGKLSRTGHGRASVWVRGPTA